MRVKAVKKVSVSLVIREMKIKTTRFFQWGLSCKNLKDSEGCGGKGT